MFDTPSANLINPVLYHGLKAVFNHVRVERPGEAMQHHYAQHLCADGVVRLRMTFPPGGQGEQFCVCCPRCGDTKIRLRINHRWGVRDSRTRSRNLWLLNCFNEGCYRGDFMQQKFLYDAVYLSSNCGGSLSDADLRPGDPAARGEFRPPGAVLSLSELARRFPKHDALEYLRSRLIDPETAAKEFDLIYCLASDFPHTSGRLIIPICHRGNLVGWQARATYEPEKDEAPKYYTGPGSNLGYGFNLERACRYHTKIIVEGAFDAFGAGPQGWALLGKTLSRTKLENLKAEVDRYRDPGSFVVVLDPDQPEVEKRKGLPHHIESAAAELAKAFGAERVAKVYLQPGMDPGAMFPGILWKLISAISAQQRVQVSQELLTPR